MASLVNISLRLPVSPTAANVSINANYSRTVSIRPVQGNAIILLYLLNYKWIRMKPCSCNV